MADHLAPRKRRSESTTPAPGKRSRFRIAPPIDPMLAKLAEALPAADPVRCEPQWDGFLAIVFAIAHAVFIPSRALRPLDRFFPALHAALLEALPAACVVDSEIVIVVGHGLNFGALPLRLRPAASRVAKLAEE